MYRLYQKNGQGFKPAFFLMTHIRPLKKMCLLGNIQLIYIFHPRKKNVYVWDKLYGRRMRKKMTDWF